MIGLGETLGDRLAALNATLNATSAVLVAAGWFAIRRGERARHRRLMVSALGVSVVFLASYLVRLVVSGTHRYPGHGLAKIVYLGVLSSHVLLAMGTVPLVLGAVWLAMRERLDAHRRVVAWALPVWLYVSVTGVAVYLMLYQALPAATPAG